MLQKFKTERYDMKTTLCDLNAKACILISFGVIDVYPYLKCIDSVDEDLSFMTSRNIFSRRRFLARFVYTLLGVPSPTIAWANGLPRHVARSWSKKLGRGKRHSER